DPWVQTWTQEYLLQHWGNTPFFVAFLPTVVAIMPLHLMWHADSFPRANRWCCARITYFLCRWDVCGDHRMIDRIYGTGGTRSDNVVEKTKKNT
ncbi:MAG TPA: hypothetical protein VJQ25_03410, partial [Nitrospira sp.]|nr:hypothetical protein [Nitrospira sp.]